MLALPHGKRKTSATVCIVPGASPDDSIQKKKKILLPLSFYSGVYVCILLFARGKVIGRKAIKDRKEKKYFFLFSVCVQTLQIQKIKSAHSVSLLRKKG